MRSVYIVIPVYNEEPVIEKTVREIRKAGYRNIVIVDDCSTDNSLDKIKNLNVYYLSHSINRGKGAALKTGIEAAKILHAKVIITIDGDGQHNPRDIKNLLTKLKTHDVVLGVRVKQRKRMPLLRRFANTLANLITWFSYGVMVSDSQCGLRAYSKKSFDLIDTKQNTYEFDSEIIREIAKHKLHYAEVPIEVRYTAYSLHKPARQKFANALTTYYKLLLDESI